MTPEDKRHLELKRKTVEAMRKAYMQAADRRQKGVATKLYNEYARALHEYRLMTRRKK